MIQTLRLLAFHLVLAASFLAFAIASSRALVFLFHRMGGYWGQIVAPSANKLASLEGLRGVLALSVVAHHAYLWYYYRLTGVWWGTDRSLIFDRLASFGVLQFFFVSGFLFWRKLMSRGNISLRNFYLSRFIRIGPAYYVCIGAAIFIAFAVSGFRLQVPFATLFASLLPWLLFCLPGRPIVNHADILRITSGVTWTLAQEWLFYLALPFLGWFSRKSSRLFLYAMIFGCLYLLGWYLRFDVANRESLTSAGEFLDQFAKYMLIGFGGGILVATLELKIHNWLRFLLPWRNWVLLGLYLAYLAVPGNEKAFEILLLPGFALVVLGADLFGLLTSRAVRLLGLISYPLYLVHGIVYYSAMRLRGGLRPVSLPAYMAETAVSLLLILLFATAVHLAVERPTMKVSENIARQTP
jgi:peptidoglycan/LPS O-acetylase OafA/YrhL